MRGFAACVLVLLALRAVSAPSAVLAQDQALPAAVHFVQRFQEAWSSGSVERVLPFFADDAVVVEAPAGGTHTGRDAVFRWLADQLGRETHIVTGWSYTVNEDPRGELVRWNARLSTFSSRTLRAPPVDARVETLVRNGKVAAHTVTTDAASVTRQHAAVRDAFATRTSLIEADGPAPGSLPPISTHAPYQPIALPNVSDRPMPAPLPWLAAGALSLVTVALAIVKRPPRV